MSKPLEQSVPGPLMLPPDDALRAARVLPGRAALTIKDVPDDEWEAFAAALSRA